MENSRFVTYTDNDRETVRKGISEIARILLGTDTDRKLSMLLCLDWFMDPYYKQDISNIHDDLVNLLQTVIISAYEDDVIEDAIDLLTSYELPPFPIIEQNRNLIPQKFQDDITYLLEMK
ncbi:MAG: hypothetical protein ACI4J0_09150 [Huintestinicola sp.]|uniref:hypothetical protein n=1 Tax=Huintestinicola sp. TaxID=2981661 RepID=UPI003F00C2FF